jgi:hypothetical protein
VALRRPEAEDVEVELEVLVVYEAEEDAALGGRSTERLGAVALGRRLKEARQLRRRGGGRGRARERR